MRKTLRRVGSWYWGLLWPARMPSTLFTVIISACLAAFTYFYVVAGVANFLSDARTSIRTTAGDKAADRRDEGFERRAGEAEASASGHEKAADGLSTERQVKEARAEDARRRADEAAVNSNRTAVNTRRARENYQKAVRGAVDDVEPVGDERLCAELAARNINVSGCR